ncbi:MAG: sulfur carrier protein ThiS [Ectothiorhodospiraceae bacterium]|nr:sulfur carrier protein ThiS [Ectothiorhodospiraceae bacterium]
MNILLNGTAHELPENSTARDLVIQLGLADKRLAMEVNREIIPRTTYQEHLLCDNDKVEIVHAIGGG